MSSQPATSEEIDAAWLYKDGAAFNTVTASFLWRDAHNIWMVYRKGAVLHVHKESVDEIDAVWEQCLQAIKQ